MGCHLAENEPLKRLARDLHLPAQCHSFRTGCLQGLKKPTGEVVLGAPGAVLGYCQALFGYAGEPERHTRGFMGALKKIGAPWWASHELFWGNRGSETPAEFFDRAMGPLAGSGRIPVVISGLDPAKDAEEISSIIATAPAIAEGETILLRVVLSGPDSITAGAALLQGLLEDAQREGRMPRWWPLFQASLSVEGWQRFRAEAGEAWKYANLAVNPFTSEDAFALIKEQITVAQLTIGLAEGMSADGTIRLAPGMRISGAADGAAWNVFDFSRRLGEIDVVPTLIILGPSLEGWSEETNRARIERFLPLLNAACDNAWSGLAAARKRMLLELAA